MEDYIKADEIKVRCNTPLKQILSLSVQEKTGIHSTVTIKAIMGMDSSDIIEQELNSQPIAIYSVRNREKQLLFSGVIGKVSIEKAAGYDTVTLLAYSLSFLMDLEKKDRSFQCDADTVQGLIQKVAKENDFEVLFSAEDKMITEPFIQYHETDWEFLHRLSTHLKVPAFVSNNYEQKGIYIGFQEETDSLELKSVQEAWCMGIEQIKSADWKAWKNTYYEVCTDQVYHVGQSVLYKNKILWIHKSTMTLTQGILKCVYQLAEKNYTIIQTAYNPYFKGLSLMGTVLARQEESIKIHLDIDEEQTIEKAHFYPWLPEHGNMVYCMPEEGDRIRLLIPDGDECNGIGINCIRQNGNICEETQNTNNRWFTTSNKKKITLQPSLVELSADNCQSRISIQDNNGNVIYSKGEVLIQAKGKVSIYGTKVVLKAPTEISAVKRQLGNPTVVNICHNLDSVGEYSTFKKWNKLNVNVSPKKTVSYKGGIMKQEIMDAERIKKEKEKLKFKMKELMEKDTIENTYDFGSSIMNIISAIPQSTEQNKLSQIAVGFRPIAGKMRGK